MHAYADIIIDNYQMQREIEAPRRQRWKNMTGAVAIFKRAVKEGSLHGDMIAVVTLNPETAGEREGDILIDGERRREIERGRSK